MQARTDEEYLNFDPYGFEDYEMRARKAKLVTTRKVHKCSGACLDGDKPHDIPVGTRVRFESAIVEGDWGSFHTCFDCIDKYLDAKDGPTGRCENCGVATPERTWVCERCFPLFDGTRFIGDPEDFE